MNTTIENLSRGGSPYDREEVERLAGYAEAIKGMAIGALAGIVVSKIVKTPTAESASIGMVVGLITHKRELSPEEG